jgi:hypothetical protein
MTAARTWFRVNKMVRWAIKGSPKWRFSRNWDTSRDVDQTRSALLLRILGGYRLGNRLLRLRSSCLCSDTLVQCWKCFKICLNICFLSNSCFRAIIRQCVAYSVHLKKCPLIIQESRYHSWDNGEPAIMNQKRFAPSMCLSAVYSGRAL